MTVSSQTVKASYLGNGVTTIFPITFEYNIEGDIGVYYTNILGVTSKVVANLAIDTVNNQVTYPVDTLITPIIVAGTKLTLIRETYVDQDLNLYNQGYFTAEQAEKAFDKLTRIAQELTEVVSRCLKYSLNEAPSVADTESYLKAITDARDAALAYKNAAESAATSSANSYDSFDDRYLGSKASDPLLNNDGDALGNGCLYFNSVSSKMRVWNGATWDNLGSTSVQIKYALGNNQVLTDIAGFLLDSNTEKSAFFRFEIERIGTNEYRQIIAADAVYDGASWVITYGNFTGHDLIQNVLETDEGITLSITGAGQVQYSTGNLPGHTESNLKVYQTRMEA